MSQVMLEDVGSQIAQLVQRASSGEDIVIIRDSTPIARITALTEDLPEEKPRSQFGNARDILIIYGRRF